MAEYNGDWTKVIEHVRVRRLILSEKDRVGIGTFQPKDEKNQDSTELTGDINYRKIAEYGSDSDPRAFNFDGEFNVANRGIIEFIEVLKLDVAFLYDLLGASQEHKIKPKKFAQTDIDEVILGHTNEPEYQKLQKQRVHGSVPRPHGQDRHPVHHASSPTRSRSTRRTSTPSKIRGKHIAPHTLEMAAMWAVLTRLEEPKKRQPDAAAEAEALRRQDAARLHRGQHQGAAQGSRARRHGRHLARATSRTRSPTRWSATSGEGCVNPFMVLNELEAGLRHHSLITNEEQRKHYRELLALVKQEYEDIVKNEVQRAISADEEAIAQLCANYIDNVKAYTQKERVKNKYTGQDEEPDERLMRSIEEKIDIPESRKDDFRREIMNYIGALAIEGQAVRLPHQRAAAQGAGAEAVRGPEGLDQADEPGVDRRRPRHAGEDRRRQEPPDPQLRLLRDLRDRRAELRRQHLRARRREGLGGRKHGKAGSASGGNVRSTARRRAADQVMGDIGPSSDGVLTRALGMLEQAVAAKATGPAAGRLRSGDRAVHGLVI